MTIEEMLKEIETRITAVGDERDKLDTLISEMTDLRESCYDAWDALQDARDALSRLA